MTQKERFRYEMFLRVRDFGAARVDRFPESSVAGRSFAVVAKTVAAIETHAAEKLLAAADGLRAKAAARYALHTRLLAVVRTARGLTLTDPGADRTFVMPRRLSDAARLTTARAFIREGEALKEKFVELGQPSSFPEDLRTLVANFEQASHTRRGGRQALAAARVGMRTAIDEASAAVRILDVVVINLLDGDDESLAAWVQARKLGTYDRAQASGDPAVPPDSGTRAAAEAGK